MYSRPARIEVNLDKLTHNIEVIRQKIKADSKIIAVVKSNAYGLGVKEIVRCLKKDIDTFAVATTSEGVELRREFEDINIFVLGYTPRYLYERTVLNSLIPTVDEYTIAEELNEVAKSLNSKLDIQIKIDTGMNRIGFKPTEKSLEDIKKISKLSNLKIVGIFSHFADSEENEEMTREQFKKFYDFTEDLKKSKVDYGIRHINNTGAVMNYPEYSLDAVRPGIAIYGTHDGKREISEEFGLEFIAELKTEIAHVKTISRGEGVSYGSVFVAERETKIATLPIGYSDGIIRPMSGKFDVLVAGRRCRQVGTICMDQMMVDVTGIDCGVGDEVVLVGEQGSEKIYLDEYSSAAGEVNTPFLTHFSSRLCRVYIKDGKILKIEDEILE